MIHPIPPGTRDVLPDEMRELRRLNRKLVDVFEGAGYGEVATPAIEYDEVLARGDRPSPASPPPASPTRRCRCASATSPPPTARCSRSGVRCGNSSRPGSS